MLFCAVPLSPAYDSNVSTGLEAYERLCSGPSGTIPRCQSFCCSVPPMYHCIRPAYRFENLERTKARSSSNSREGFVAALHPVAVFCSAAKSLTGLTGPQGLPVPWVLLYIESEGLAICETSSQKPFVCALLFRTHLCGGVEVLSKQAGELDPTSLRSISTISYR